MFKWRTTLALELKLIFKNPFYLLLPVLFAGWMFWILSVPRAYGPSDLLTNTQNFHKLAHTMTLGVAFLLGTLLIRRDLQLTSFEWMKTFPKSLVGTVLAKYTAGMLYLSTFTVAMVAVYTSVGVFQREETFDQFAVYLVNDIVQYELSYAVTLSLAMLLTAIIPHRVIYLIGFCTWMFGTFFMDIFIISRGNLYSLKTFHLNQYFLDSLMFTEVWGLHLLWNEIWLSRLFVLGFSIMLLVGVITLLKGHVSRREKNGWRIGSCVSILLACLTFLPYGFVWADHLAQVNIAESDAYDLEELEKDYQLIDVLSYQIDMHRHPNDSIEASAFVEVNAESLLDEDVLYFRLNPLLNLDRLTWDNEQIAYDREGSLITIPLNESKANSDTVTLHFSYSGPLTMWGHRSGREQYFSFLDGENIMLPSTIAWYPLAGDQPIFIKLDTVTTSDEYDYEGSRYRDRYDFDLTLTGFTQEIFASAFEAEADSEQQVFSKENGTGVSLFGGNLTKFAPIGEMEAIGSPSMEKRFEPILAQFNTVSSYLNENFPTDTNIENKIFLLPEEYMRRTFYNGVEVHDDVYTMNSYNNHFSAIDSWYMSELIHDIIKHHFYGEYSMKGRIGWASLEGLVSEFAYMVLLLEHYGITEEEMIEELNITGIYDFLISDNDYDESISEEWVQEEIYVKEQGRKLLNALKEGRIDDVKRFLNILYEKEIEPFSKQGQPFPFISPEVWEETWEQVIGDGE
ncbi:hypothetical protein MM221_13440 [Salipaludibacillus sp. LMS25]|uniref:ABC transporter permease n=1 Tax=Salipaludibacillus sp. LMS25 TaxID=2924031 RepID=UPI0020D12FE9|nr:hypothetical protein [Salipaludibacillus sp. LMS25]UTR13622.1 hypothetical protein MM221_13440 [Salipaludibacillus sp. LMS25]